MKLLVVVSVVVACGPAVYEDLLLKSLKCCGDLLPTLGVGNHHVETDSWFIWMPGSGDRLPDLDDDLKISDEHSVITRPSSEYSTTQSLKYSYLDDWIPSTPGDNSHYVEGQSRYIWMPDGKGSPHLVDLLELDNEGPDERSIIDTEYWLFTRRNPFTPQEIVLHRPDSIYHSHFMPSKPMMVIVHGWLSDSQDDFSSLMKSTYLAVEDANVIVVDWRNLAKTGYGNSVQAVPEVGRHIAGFMSWLIETSGASWSNIHLIGFSLGAHIAGSAGRFAGGRPGRVTGLDPAGPLFYGNPDNLSPIDAQYVEVIHTDGDRLGHFGSLGQVDFYANGGRNPQPGCFISTCSHSRVVDLFAASVRYNHLVGNRCKNITEAEEARCNGDELKLGNSILPKHGSGIYGLRTASAWPY